METGETLSFSELAVRVDRIAAALAGIGICHGDRVAIMLPNRAEWSLAWLGLRAATWSCGWIRHRARIGAVMVPINTGYQIADAGFVLKHAGVRAVITMGGLVPLLLDVRKGTEAADRLRRSVRRSSSCASTAMRMATPSIE